MAICLAGAGLTTAAGHPAWAAPHSLPDRGLHAGAPTEPAECDITVAPGVEVLDGQANLAQLEPGAVICLDAGTRGNLKVSNLHGTPGNHFTIRNSGGQVRITGSRFEAGIFVETSSHVRITGSGVDAQCGARFGAEQQQCGIVVDGARKGIKVATSRGDASELEFDHIAIERVSDEEETRGIAIHPVSRQVVSGIRIHHNYVANTLAEAIYVGSDPRGRPFEELGKVERVEIAYNRVDQIAWDGIKLKVSIGESSIHHNVLSNTGTAGYANHESGITVATSRVDVHSNSVVGSVEGIKSGRPLDAPGNQYYNNVVADVETLGIQTAEDGARIFHNTVVGSNGFGIRARGDGSLVSENIVADAEQPIVVRRDSVERNNLAGSVTDVRFADPELGNFSLDPSSPAVDAGRAANPAGCAGTGIRMVRPLPRRLYPDHNGIPRPRGCRSDIGAYELVAIAHEPSRPERAERGRPRNM